MLIKDMEKKLNEQLNYELFSSYIYLAMSADFKDKGFNGMANWMQVQAQEELVHAMGFYTFILNRGGKVELMKVDAPPQSWKSALDAFSHALKHEQSVTERIGKIAKFAKEQDDFPTANFIQWYVNEQVEEEQSAQEIVNQLKMIGESTQALFMIDKALAARTFRMPMIPGGMTAAN